MKSSEEILSNNGLTFNGNDSAQHLERLWNQTYIFTITCDNNLQCPAMILACLRDTLLEDELIVNLMWKDLCYQEVPRVFYQTPNPKMSCREIRLVWNQY